jgi:hypothetical protein
MRCTVCTGPLIYDRIDDEARCLICGRPAPNVRARRAVPAERRREEYPRRYKTSADDTIDCWG